MTERYYFAITNHCNRRCELCCCYSDPGRSTYLPLEKFKEILPGEGEFEIQMEGGEPLLHPDLDDMIFYAQGTGRCTRVTLGTNAALLPYSYSGLKQNAGSKLNPEKSVEQLKHFFLKYNPPFVLKPSINYHLIETDNLHLDKAEVIRDCFEELKSPGDYSLVFNARRRKKPMAIDDDQWLVNELEKRGLAEYSNIFFYQRYGLAKDRDELELPFIIENPVEFHLISPDGKNWGTELIARSESMKNME